MSNVAEALAQPSAGLRSGTGILPYQTILAMIQNKEIISEVDFADGQVQPASIDLRLGHVAYPVNTSFLPGSGLSVREKMKQLDENYEQFGIKIEGGAVLEKDRLYVIPLLETLDLRADIMGLANPKSSTGRLDILTRLITDEGTSFDQVKKGYKGNLYIEVAPRTFSIVVRTGDRLNQLRFQRARGAAAQSIGAEEWRQLVSGEQVVRIENPQHEKTLYEETGMLPFTVDLRAGGEDGALIGYRAKRHAPRIDLALRDYDPRDFWEEIRFSKDKPASLILDPEEFYILMTKEPIAVPPEYAAEMLPYDTRAGEFRVHYAGFFDPGFGWDAGAKKVGASRGVLEVRSHEVPFLLEHGQIVGWLKYEKMAAVPSELYGHTIASNYQGQALKLAKQFR